MWHGSWHGMECQVELTRGRTKYRVDSDIRERVFGNWTRRDTGELTGNVLQEAREIYRKSTQEKVRPGHVDVSLPLEGTNDVLITGGPSAEHLRARIEPGTLHNIVSLLLTMTL